MRITSLGELAHEYERGKQFKVRGNEGEMHDYDVATKTIAELDNLLSYYQLFSVHDRDRAKAEWLFVTEMEGQSFVPSNGYCWACEGDLVQHFLDTEQYSPSRCLLCDHDFIQDA